MNSICHVLRLTSQAEILPVNGNQSVKPKLSHSFNETEKSVGRKAWEFSRQFPQSKKLFSSLMKLWCDSSFVRSSVDSFMRPLFFFLHVLLTSELIRGVVFEESEQWWARMSHSMWCKKDYCTLEFATGSDFYGNGQEYLPFRAPKINFKKYCLPKLFAWIDQVHNPSKFINQTNKLREKFSLKALIDNSYYELWKTHIM